MIKRRDYFLREAFAFDEPATARRGLSQYGLLQAGFGQTFGGEVLLRGIHV